MPRPTAARVIRSLVLAVGLVLLVAPALAHGPRQQRVDDAVSMPAARQAQLFVEWGGSWWAARVLGTGRDGSVRVHYLGWGSEWDEAVAPSRLLHLSGAP